METDYLIIISIVAIGIMAISLSYLLHPSITGAYTGITTYDTNTISIENKTMMSNGYNIGVNTTNLTLAKDWLEFNKRILEEKESFNRKIEIWMMVIATLLVIFSCYYIYKKAKSLNRNPKEHTLRE